MRVLIDECIDPRVKALFTGHDARTVHEMGWDQLLDGPLLQIAQRSFDVFVTIDRSLEFQQNIEKLALGVIVIRVTKNQMPFYVELKSEILAAVGEAQAGCVVHVGD